MDTPMGDVIAVAKGKRISAILRKSGATTFSSYERDNLTATKNKKASISLHISPEFLFPPS